MDLSKHLANGSKQILILLTFGFRQFLAEYFAFYKIEGQSVCPSICLC